VAGRGENLSGVLQNVPGQAGVNHARVFDEKVGEGAGGNQEAERHETEQRQPEGGSPKAFL